MQFLNSWFFLQNSLYNWLVALVVFVASLGILLLLRNKILTRLARLAHIRRIGVSDIALDLLSNTHLFFLFGIALYMATIPLELSDKVNDLLRVIVVILILLQVAVWGSRLITFSIARFIARREDHLDSSTLNLLGFFARVVLWTVVILVILDNIPNFRVNTIVTSLGITGLAVAIAVQRILGDVFASLSIALDRPFEVGDFIVVGDYLGTVERVGIKSTRIRSLTGEQIIISNSDLLGSRIQNFKRMKDRRVTFHIKVSARTPHEKLLRIPRLVEEIISEQPSVRFGRAHFRDFADSTLNYEVVYYLLSPDYELYMDIQQNINLALLRSLAAEEIPLAAG